jgi:proline iminopeptidase
MSSGHRHYLDTAGARLCMTLRGQGPPLVLLHGGPGVGDYLGDSDMAAWLSERYTVCAYDQRGCRDSHSDGPFTLAANVEDLEAVRLYLGGGVFTLVGHSWGAFLGLYYAAYHPQAVRRLVLISPVPPRTGWQRRRHQLLDARHTPSQRAELERINAAIARTRDAAARERLYLEHFNAALPSYPAPAHRAVAPRIEWYSRKINVETMADLHRVYADRSWEAGLRRFRAPTLIVHGREDIIPWSAVAVLESLVPHARLVGLDNCGHFPWLETAHAMRQLLEGFLFGSS